MSRPQLSPMGEAARARAVAIAASFKSRNAGRVWGDMPRHTRVVLVMLAAHDAQGDPATLAGQAWERFSEGDRARIGAMARDLQRDLRDAGGLVL